MCLDLSSSHLIIHRQLLAARCKCTVQHTDVVAHRVFKRPDTRQAKSTGSFEPLVTSNRRPCFRVNRRRTHVHMTFCRTVHRHRCRSESKSRHDLHLPGPISSASATPNRWFVVVTSVFGCHVHFVFLILFARAFDRAICSSNWISVPFRPALRLRADRHVCILKLSENNPTLTLRIPAFFLSVSARLVPHSSFRLGGIFFFCPKSQAN